MDNLNQLLNLLQLEQIEENIFRGPSHLTPWGAVYGGQVLAQALHAAAQTVPADRYGHSLHAYFILRGDPTLPIVYEVDRIRDGGSFTTRRIVAIQKGRPIFNMSASFQLEQPGFEHQVQMPEVVGPDDLPTDIELLGTQHIKISEAFKDYRKKSPIEVRPVEHFEKGKAAKPNRHLWIKVKGTLPKDKRCHQEILAYASDSNLLATALLPHRDTFDSFTDLQMASLDHSMWFHQDFDMEEWLLYALTSPSTSNSRGFAQGHLFKQDGTLVASVAQEGLLRKRAGK